MAKKAKPGRGGARAGAGRKPSGRKIWGVDFKKEALKSGTSPLEYMLRIMRDVSQPNIRRDKMAMAAAPFCHARLQAIEQTLPPGNTPRELSPDMTAQEAQEAYAATIKESGLTRH